MTGTADRQIQQTDQHGDVPARFRAMVATVHRYRPVALGVAAVVGFAGGWLTALVMPRGPTTPGGVGRRDAHRVSGRSVTGLAMRSRWAILVAHPFLVTTFEMSRTGAVGRRSTRPSSRRLRTSGTSRHLMLRPWH